MSFARTAFTVLTTQFAVLPIALLTSVVLARLLSVEDRGVYALASGFATLAVIVSRFGWPSAVVFRIRRARAPVSLVAGAAVVLWAVLSLLSVGACLVFEPFLLSRFFPDASRTVFLIAVAVIPFQLASAIFTGVARALGRFDVNNAQQIGVSVGLLVAVGVGLLLFPRVALTAVLALLCVHAVVALTAIALVLRISGVRLAGAAREIREAAGFGAKTHAQSLLLDLHQHLDVFLLAFFLDDAAQIGIYAVAVSVVSRVRVIPMSITLVMFPAVAELDPSRAAVFVGKVSRHSMVWILCTIVVLGASVPVIVPLLFGEPYRASVLPLLVLLPGSGMLTVYMVLARYFIAMDRHRVTIASQAISLAANIALNVVLIPAYGVLGAAIASTISYSLQGAMMVLAFSRAAGIGLRRAAVPGREELEDYHRRGRAAISRFRREH